MQREGERRGKREGGRDKVRGRRLVSQERLQIPANVHVHTCSVNKLLMKLESEQRFSKLLPEVAFHCTCQCLCVPLVHITEVQLINLSSLNGILCKFVCF